MNQQKLAQVAAQLKKSRVREIVWLRLFWLFFLGGFGAHKFYLGKIGQGFLYLIFLLDIHSINYRFH
ncbi:putative membrane protein [Yersinia enterocolitica subsp. palearctica 105.5R(r)]|nr:putative membrane protein [Yersinia enterocolitica subsp. palearctica 105.5R(r)]